MHTPLRRRVFVAVPAIALCALLLTVCPGCADEQPPPAPVATPLDPATFGGVKGMVRLDGPDPAPVPLTMGTDVCRDFPPASDPARGLVKNGLVKDVFVRITKGLEGKVFARPETFVEIDQRGCLFEPRVVGVRPGQYTVFKNSDPVAHNVRIDAPKRGTNRTLPSKGTSFNWWFAEAAAAPVLLNCDVHPWMRGYLFVVDHPFFGTTGADGDFAFKNLPAGVYDFEAWSEAFGSAKAKGVKIEPGVETAVTLTFAAPK